VSKFMVTHIRNIYSYTCMHYIYTAYQRCVQKSCLYTTISPFDRLCGLVIRVSGYRSRSPDSNLREVVGLERDPFSLVSTTEELLGRKSTGSGLESRGYGRRNPNMPQYSFLYLYYNYKFCNYESFHYYT
jgi:hypothetical protein